MGGDVFCYAEAVIAEVIAETVGRPVRAEDFHCKAIVRDCVVRFRVGASGKVISEQRSLFKHSSNSRADNTYLHGESLDRAILSEKLYNSRAIGIVALYLFRYRVGLGNLAFNGGNEVSVDKDFGCGGVFVRSICRHLHCECVVKTYFPIVLIVVAQSDNRLGRGWVNTHYSSIDRIAFYAGGNVLTLYADWICTMSKSHAANVFRVDGD